MERPPYSCGICPTREKIEALWNGALDDDVEWRGWVKGHLLSCDSCAEIYADVVDQALQAKTMQPVFQANSILHLPSDAVVQVDLKVPVSVPTAPRVQIGTAVGTVSGTPHTTQPDGRAWWRNFLSFCLTQIWPKPSTGTLVFAVSMLLLLVVILGKVVHLPNSQPLHPPRVAISLPPQSIIDNSKTVSKREFIAHNRHEEQKFARLQHQIDALKARFKLSSVRHKPSPTEVAMLTKQDINRATFPDNRELVSDWSGRRDENPARQEAPHVLPISPLATWVTNVPPPFQWHAIPEATAYHIELQVNDGEKVVSEATLPGKHGPPPTTWKFKGHLVPGIIYRWTVSLEDTKHRQIDLDWAYFQTLTEAQMRQLTSRLTGQPLNDALEYARVGCYQQAEYSLAAYCKVHPNNPVAKLLQKRLAGVYKQSIDAGTTISNP